MNPTQFADEVRSALDRVAGLQLRAQTASPEEVQHVLVESLEELTTAFAELETAQEELRSQNELLAAAEVLAVAERDRYRDLFEFAPSGYLVTNPEGVIQQANRAACELFNVALRYLVNKPLAVYVHPDDKAAFHGQITAIQRGQSAWEATYRFVARDGDVPTVAAVTVVPFRDPESRIPLLRWQFRDVTDQWHAADESRRMHAALETQVRERTSGLELSLRAKEAAEERLRFLSESSALFVSTLDTDTALGHIGARAVPYLGDWCFVEFADADVPTRTCPLVVAHPDHADRVRSAPAAVPARPLVIQDTAAPPPGLSLDEAARVRLFADLGWVSVLWLPLTASGRTVGGLAVGSGQRDRWTELDVTVAGDFARQAAMALGNAELYRRMRETDRRKGEFVSVVAHEMRSPLGPIRNAAQILSLKAAGDPDLKMVCGVLDRQTAKLGRMVEDLLDAAKLTLGKVRLNVEALDLCEIAETAAITVRPAAAGRGLQLVVSTPGEPVPVKADPGRLEQVVGNLLDNAVKYTEAGGTVTLTVDRDGEAAEVRVRDTGVGIPPDVLPRVFDLYAQANGSISRAQGGLGVGLAVVKQLVQLHGGTVQARSGGPGRGSEFVIRLPAVEAAVAEAEAELVEMYGPHACGETPALRVLVIDDDRAGATTLAKLLEAAGHRATVSLAADPGLKQARTEVPDVVVLAPDLSDVSGREVARRLRGWPETRGATVVAFGGSAPPGRNGSDDFHHRLPKPATPEAVKALMLLIGASRAGGAFARS